MAAPDAQDSSAGIAELLPRLRPRLLRFLSRSRIPAFDREDLLQDALLDLVVKWPLIRQPELWLFQALHYKCLCYQRAHRRGLLGKLLAVDSHALEHLAGAAPSAEHDSGLDVSRLTRELPARQRRILWLFYGLGLSEDEVAQRLSTTMHSLHKDRWRAIFRLRRAFAKAGEPGNSRRSSMSRQVVKPASRRVGK